MFEHIGWTEVTKLIIEGLQKAIANKRVTYDLERQMETEPVGNDLTSVNILMQKQQMIETQMQVFKIVF